MNAQLDEGTTVTDRPGCVFCRIVDGAEPATVVASWSSGVMAIVPLNPVTPGHVLVLPAEHVEDFTVDPDVSARCMRAAAELAVSPANVITSAGVEATQTVRYLHLHVVPRSAGDGLNLPWTDQPALDR